MNHVHDFNSLCDAYCNAYIREFGERKFKTVLDKVMTSDKISGLISTSRYRMATPGAKTFLACINEINYFIFSRNETQALAGLLAVSRWNLEANQFPAFVSDEQLYEMAVFILTELRCTNF
jgi:hypothetical protein